MSVYKLASTLNKDFESISSYLHYLEQAGLIRFIYPNKSGKAFLRNPTKMYPENTNMVYAQDLSQMQDTRTGKVCETFVVNQLQNSNNTVFYSEVGDFSVNNIIFEVGGKNKTKQQVKGHKNAYIIADNILVGSTYKIPLYLFGFLS